jgi:hypothetical protein
MSALEDSTSNKRGTFLTVMAILLFVLAFSDFTKPLQHLRQPHALGLVIFGYRFSSFGSNLILGPLFGLFLATYAYGIWTMRRWVMPLAIAYALYVPFNLVLFWFTHTEPPHPTLGFIIFYLFVSLLGSVGTGLYLAYHHDRLR